MFIRVGHSVFRDTNGVPRGPYHYYSLDSLCNALDDMQNFKSHPSMWNDIGSCDEEAFWLTRDQREEYYCGFNSMDALVEWFGPVFDELHASGFVIYRYDIECLTGRKQSVAKLRKVRPFDIADISELSVNA